MRIVDDAFDAEVAGTTSGDRLEVHAWRGGQLVAGGLDVSAWSVDWDADRQVQGQGTWVVADPDGALAPWGMGDALGPGGSRLQVTWVSGLSGTRVPLGWWRVRQALPAESWRVHARDGVVRLVPGGGSVTVRADEETATIGLDRLDAEVVRTGTCLAEIRRLLADICAVTVDPAVTDKAVPGGLVYGDSRADAVDDLLTVLDATHRMGGDGSLQVVPAAGVGPVWTIAGGEQGAQVDLTRALSDEGVYNGVVSSAETADHLPLVGRAYVTGGPLAWGGPFGRVPLFHRSPATSQGGVESDARTLLASRQAAGEVDLDVTCLTHPGVQPGDRVTVVAATTAGEQPLVGRVVGMTMSAATSDAGTTPAKTMRLRVRVPAGDLEVVAGRVRRG